MVDEASPVGGSTAARAVRLAHALPRWQKPPWMKFATALAAVLAALVPSRVEAGAVRSSTSGAFQVDPVTDPALLVGTGGFGLVLELIITTGELRPLAPIDPGNLLFIDRPTALAAPGSSSHEVISNALVGGAILYALADTTWALFEERSCSAIAYATLYAESAIIDLAMTDLVKIAVRRPRPSAYRQLRATGMVEPGTDTALSFYSGHTSLTAALSGTAAYLAFTRSDGGVEGWLVAGGGVLLTTLVGIERVRAGAHFPTDVIAGALAGASVGILVPHLHRSQSESAGLGMVRVSGFTSEGGTIGLSIFGAF
jgi:membrane-associated phospholipid phosphatase